MSRMLSGFDLIRLEEKLRNEVSEKFGSTVWDSKELVGSDVYEMDMRSWRRMMSLVIHQQQDQQEGVWIIEGIMILLLEIVVMLE